VIAIIAILAAILFPVFARAREQARKATCQSNLKQIGLSMAMYRQDYDGLMPVGNHPTNGSCPEVFQRTGWEGYPSAMLHPYVKNKGIWSCPSDSRTGRGGHDSDNNRCGAVGTALYNANEPFIFKVSYAYNYLGINASATNTGNSMPGFGANEAAALRAADQAVAWDSNNKWPDFNAGFWGRDITQYANKIYAYGARHSETLNFLYLDGHVKTGKWDQMRYQNVFNIPDGDPRFNRAIMQLPYPP